MAEKEFPEYGKLFWCFRWSSKMLCNNNNNGFRNGIQWCPTTRCALPALAKCDREEGRRQEKRTDGLRQWFPNFSGHHNSVRGQMKHGLLGPTLSVSNPAGRRWHQECTYLASAWLMLTLLLLVRVPPFEYHWVGEAREPGMATVPSHDEVWGRKCCLSGYMKQRWLV